MTTGMNGWWRDADLPLKAFVVFAVLALCFWVNAAVNRYRFWVALALIASVPLAFVLVRGAQRARAAQATGRE